MKHTNGPHDAPSNQGRHPHGRNDAPSNRAPLVPPSKNAPSRRKLFQTGRSGALSERMGANWDTDRAISFRDCTTCCEVAPSRSAIAPNGTKGCLSPNGQCTLWADGMPHPKRTGTTRADGVFPRCYGVFPLPTGGFPVLTPQPSLAATKHPRTNPRPQRNKRHAENNRRFPCVNAAAVLGCAQMRSKNAPPHQPTKPTTK